MSPLAPQLPVLTNLEEAFLEKPSGAKWDVRAKPDSLALQIVDYRSYRPHLAAMQKSLLRPLGIVDNATLAMSRHSNLDLKGRQKAMEVVRKYAVRE